MGEKTRTDQGFSQVGPAFQRDMKDTGKGSMHRRPRLSSEEHIVGGTMPMKRNYLLIWLGAVLLLSLAVVVVIVQYYQPRVFAEEPKRYQYKIVEVSKETDHMQAILNEYGHSGWELVAVGMGDLAAPKLIFKK
ncbi:hypothetical protein DNFV4_03218 [Nitrospira tepida]|uniref:DUF4177 domain-containing protein n=2 Tax=Nitrospira tepida TaxID=2973512 RepID=A0AA86N148_9BACT|nr:hypothetical protein DNFV4_03218 [Nitrospira tepida]